MQFFINKYNWFWAAGLALVCVYSLRKITRTNKTKLYEFVFPTAVRCAQFA